MICTANELNTTGKICYGIKSNKFFFRVINKRIQQLKILDAETDSSSEEEESESDEGYADAEFTNSSSEEEEDESDDE